MTHLELSNGRFNCWSELCERIEDEERRPHFELGNSESKYHARNEPDEIQSTCSLVAKQIVRKPKAPSRPTFVITLVHFLVSPLYFGVVFGNAKF
jgi:hypothetical protein